MEKEFVPYEEALELRELGFDEPCLGIYKKIKNKNPFKLKGVAKFEYKPNSVNSDFMVVPTAPTWGAAFRWFREKHKLHSFVMSDNCIKDTYAYNIGFLAEEEEELYMMEGVCKGEVKLGFKTPEKAELACLKRLIEIVKQ